MTFNQDDHDHEHLHGVVHDNITIFGNNKGVNIVSNNSTKRLKIWLKNLIFHFSSAMHDFLCEVSAINKIVNRALTIFS
jgi:hypothetical protein